MTQQTKKELMATTKTGRDMLTIHHLHLKTYKGRMQECTMNGEAITYSKFCEVSTEATLSKDRFTQVRYFEGEGILGQYEKDIFIQKIES